MRRSDHTPEQRAWPAEQPRYTIVVLQDTQAEPAFSSAAIFARVAAGLEILAP